MESAAAGSSTKRLNENESIDVKRKFVEEIDPLDEIFSKKYKRFYIKIHRIFYIHRYVFTLNNI
jgi:hypothetical protein